MDSTSLVQQIVLAGVMATVVFDLWQCLVKRVFGIPQTNWALVGRWFSYLPQGQIVHQAIGKTKAAPYEAVTGWVTHYLVGLIYAAVYLGVVWLVLGSGPTFATAVGFGVVTVVAPWFLLQPGMGLGVLASKAPNAGVIRAHSLSSHVAFGLGLYLAFRII